MRFYLISIHIVSYFNSAFIITIGSLVCGISTNFPIMMGGRVLQAIGAGILMPLGSNVIVTIFPPENVVWQWEQWVLQ